LSFFLKHQAVSENKKYSSCKYSYSSCKYW